MLQVAETESLSDYVRRLMSQKNLTYQAVSDRSGSQISAGYVNDIVLQKTINPSVDKLSALARGLGVPEDEVFAIARGKNEDIQPKKRIAVLFHKFNETDDEDLINMEPIIAMLERELDARKRLRESQGK